MLFKNWDNKRKYSPRALLEQRYDRLSSLRESISALPFEHLDRCPFSETFDCEQTVVAMFDRYGLPVRLALCSHTGLLYLLDRLTPSAYSTFYESGLYREVIAAFRGRENSTESSRLAEQLKEATVTANALVNALRHLPLMHDASLLDIGGSVGTVSRVLREILGVRPTVLDPSEKELAVAAENGLQVTCGTIEDAEFHEGTKFDVVLLVQTIEHLSNIRSAFRKIHSVLQDSGYVVFDIVDFIAASTQSGCAQATSRLDHSYFLYDEMMDVFCKRVGLRIEQRIWYWRTRVLYVCRKSAVDDSSLFPEGRRLGVTRELFSQYVSWYRSPRILEYSFEERLLNKLSSVARLR